MRALSAAVATVEAITLALPSICRACPACPVGTTARAQFFADGFAQNLLIALAPFIAIAMISLAAENIGRHKS